MRIFINPAKSILHSCQRILPWRCYWQCAYADHNGKDRLTAESSGLLIFKWSTIERLVWLVGFIVTILPEFKLSKLHYSSLLQPKVTKSSWLDRSSARAVTKCHFPRPADIEFLTWWRSNSANSGAQISEPEMKMRFFLWMLAYKAYKA